jgi:Tol biopolymer transport system component
VYDLPTWSTDGERLAYSAVSLSRINDSQALVFTSASDGGDQRKIFQSQDEIPVYLSWSPDDEVLSFITQDSLQGGLDLQLVSTGQPTVRTVDSGRPFFMAWSPLGDQLLTHVGGSSTRQPDDARVTVIDPSNRAGARNLAFSPADFQAPEYAPDGRHILVGSEDGLSILDLDGKVLAAIPGSEHLSGFGWSPSGKYVAYIASEREDMMLGSLRLAEVGDRNNPAVSDPGIRNAIAFFWAPEEDRLVYFVRVSPAPEPFELERGPPLLRAGFLDVQTNTQTPIGEFIPTANFETILAYFDQYQRSATIWSPDGEYIVLAMRSTQGRSSLFIVHSSGQLEPQFLIEGLLAFWSPR